MEQLPEHVQSSLIELSMNSRLIDIIQSLKEQGIDTSTSALSRFIRKHRQRDLVEEGAEMREAVEAFAERGRHGKMREGTLEAVRQRLYERALVSQNAEEARELYSALVKEEGRLKELELEARKVAAMEQQVKLQGLRIQVLAEQSGKGRTKAVVSSSEAVVDVPAARQLGEASSQREKGLLGLLGEVSEILNREGTPDEKVIAARAVVSEGIKGVEAVKSDPRALAAG